MAEGTQVLFNLSDRSNEWAEISTPQGLRGWVPSHVLKTSADSVSFQGSMKVKTLDGGSVNVRSQPSLNGPIIATVSTGQIVQYWQNVGYWAEVTAPNGQRGYISHQFLVCP